MSENSAESRNMTLLSQNDLNGFGNGGEGLAMQVASDGRRILYIAHESAPKNFTGVDVSDPRNPKVVVQTDLPHSEVRSNSLAVVGDVMLVAFQTARPGGQPAGVGAYDISVPSGAHSDLALRHLRTALARSTLPLVGRRPLCTRQHRRGGL